MPTFAETLNQSIMTLSLKDGQITISIEFVATDEKPITVEDVLIGAYNIISREYSQEEVIKAYYRTDPDTMDLRTEVEYPDYVKKILERLMFFLPLLEIRSANLRPVLAMQGPALPFPSEWTPSHRFLGAPLPRDRPCPASRNFPGRGGKRHQLWNC